MHYVPDYRCHGMVQQNGEKMNLNITLISDFKLLPDESLVALNSAFLRLLHLLYFGFNVPLVNFLTLIWDGFFGVRFAVKGGGR